ncbi:uncharacterized protein LOC121985908 isoform X1 [Zingiber officinale]|uniref:uncharacterized protein LOC121985908 isoform X1 n=1 Tax=Zingiber officinale TaxID=94328 RepID=UPI001C4D3430|nr:uncharacterized protein LOC121985908 isoform X1 [Zingiber officinale]
MFLKNLNFKRADVNLNFKRADVNLNFKPARGTRADVNCLSKPHSPNYQFSHPPPARRYESERREVPIASQSMAFSVHWYDLLCFALVAAALAASLSCILAGERSCKARASSIYRRLLSRGEDGGGGGGEEAGEVLGCELWISRWRPVHPAALLGVRLAAAAAMIGVFIWDLRTYDWSIMLYYTEWTFLLVIIYFLIASVISAYGCWMYGKRATENDEANAFLKEDVVVDIPVTLNATNRNKNASKSRSNYEHGYYQQKAGFWGYLMLIAYQTSAGAVVLTDIVFWGLLVPFLTDEHFKLDLLMGCMHTLNFIFLLLDTTLNSLPFPWFRMAYFVLWSCIYVIFQWILHACGFSWWPYPFLELSTSWAPLWYLCLGLLHIPCYGIYALIVSAKNSLFSRIFHHAYRRS